MPISTANLTPTSRILAFPPQLHTRRISDARGGVPPAACTSTILTRCQRGLTVTVPPNKRWRQKPAELNRPIYPLHESFATSAIHMREIHRPADGGVILFCNVRGAG
jgi:hypothetical protein